MGGGVDRHDLACSCIEIEPVLEVRDVACPSIEELSRSESIQNTVVPIDAQDGTTWNECRLHLQNRNGNTVLWGIAGGKPSLSMT